MNLSPFAGPGSNFYPESSPGLVTKSLCTKLKLWDKSKSSPLPLTMSLLSQLRWNDDTFPRDSGVNLKKPTSLPSRLTVGIHVWSVANIHDWSWEWGDRDFEPGTAQNQFLTLIHSRPCANCETVPCRLSQLPPEIAGVWPGSKYPSLQRWKRGYKQKIQLDLWLTAWCTSTNHSYQNPNHYQQHYPCLCELKLL